MTRRSTSRAFLGVLLALAVTPALFAATSKYRPMLAGAVAPVPLSLVRSAEPVPASDLGVERARNRVVIEALPPPQVAITLENVNTDEKATFSFGYSGELRPDQAAAVAHFFRCRRTGREKKLSPGVLAILVDIARRWPGRTIEVVSGFRAPPYGAPHSKHFRGHAIDLRVPGVRSAAIRDFVWRGHHQVGVGHYTRENFVHVDFRPGEQDMAWSAVEEDHPPQYNPRWSVKARRAQRRLASGV